MFSSANALHTKTQYRVELDTELAGSIRYETLWEIMRQKKLPLPGDGSLRGLKNALSLHAGNDAKHISEMRELLSAPLIGDLEAIERCFYEFVEDRSGQGVAYCEVKLCPHLLTPGLPSPFQNIKQNGTNGFHEDVDHNIETVKEVTPNSILEAALRGIAKGEEDYGNKVKIIMVCPWQCSDWAWDLLRMCEEFKDRGVVGLCLSGSVENKQENDVIKQRLTEVFQNAKEKQIHRALELHESQDLEQIRQLMEVCEPERISVGAHVMEHDEILRKCLDEKIHLQLAPYWSMLGQAVSESSERNLIWRLIEEGGNFSINSNQPTITNKTLQDDYDLLRNWSLNESHFSKCNFQAAVNSFLNPQDKKQLIDSLKISYGVIDYEVPVISPTSSPVAGMKANYSKPSIKIASWEDRK